jgi:hypothetical protein
VNRLCRDCRNTFAGEAWMTRCKTCFIEMKRREESGSDVRDAYRDGYRDGVGSTLDGDLVRDLIALCHPDRHPGRFELANCVTARLVQMRDQLRRAA